MSKEIINAGLHVSDKVQLMDESKDVSQMHIKEVHKTFDSDILIKPEILKNKSFALCDVVSAGRVKEEYADVLEYINMKEHADDFDYPYELREFKDTNKESWFIYDTRTHAPVKNILSPNDFCEYSSGKIKLSNAFKPLLYDDKGLLVSPFEGWSLNHYSGVLTFNKKCRPGVRHDLSKPKLNCFILKGETSFADLTSSIVALSTKFDDLSGNISGKIDYNEVKEISGNLVTAIEDVASTSIQFTETAINDLTSTMFNNYPTSIRLKDECLPSGLVKSVNDKKPDENGNIEITIAGSSVVIDTSELSSIIRELDIEGLSGDASIKNVVSALFSTDKKVLNKTENIEEVAIKVINEEEIEKTAGTFIEIDGKTWWQTIVNGHVISITNTNGYYQFAPMKYSKGNKTTNVMILSSGIDDFDNIFPLNVYSVVTLKPEN